MLWAGCKLASKGSAAAAAFAFVSACCTRASGMNSELDLGYHNSDAISWTTYPYHGNLI